MLRRVSRSPMGAPSTVARPPVGRVSPSSSFTTVVLPAPFGPRKPKTSPAPTRIDRSATAWTRPYRFASPSVAMIAVGSAGAATAREVVARDPSGPIVRADHLEEHPDDDRPDQCDDDGGDEAGAALEAELRRDPAADDRPEDTDDDVRQAAAGGSAADDHAGQRSGDEAEDDPVDEIAHGAESATSGSPRKASIAATNCGAWVWCAACRAPAIVTTRPFRSRASRARVASANGSGLSPPRIWSTGWWTPPRAASEAASLVSARSSRIVVWTAAARRGQMGSARNAASSGSGIPTFAS